MIGVLEQLLNFFAAGVILYVATLAPLVAVAFIMPWMIGVVIKAAYDWDLPSLYDIADWPSAWRVRVMILSLLCAAIALFVVVHSEFVVVHGELS